MYQGEWRGRKETVVRFLVDSPQIEILQWKQSNFGIFRWSNLPISKLLVCKVLFTDFIKI